MMKKLFEDWAGEQCLDIQPLSAHGSNRLYYRLKGQSKQCLLAKNDDVRENEAFLYYSDFFIERGVAVPKVYSVDSTKTMYLLEDLGNTTLYDFLQAKKNNNTSFDDEVKDVYKRLIDSLLDMQFVGKDADFSNSYPRAAFDIQSICWDLNYFKYHFLKLAYIPFDEQLLENDCNTFATYLSGIDSGYFLYRDFQSRNIMLHNNSLYFIDYQGGRRGALHYDLASLLFDAKAEMPNQLREQLLDYYVSKLADRQTVDKEQFKQEYYCFVLLRIMQAMGAYGYRGFYEGKEHFVRSIAPAVANMQWLIENKEPMLDIPHLKKVWNSIVHSAFLADKVVKLEEASELTVSINSFSFKRGYPQDASGNGGGFVFDCRALPNPGRYQQYKNITGKDQPVIEFLEKEPEVKEFLTLVFDVVAKSVRKYRTRKFTSLQVNFGCTGGQHRSVYCAEQLANYIKSNFDCNVVVRHLEQE